MKSKSRRTIEKWLKEDKGKREPRYIAEGFVFLYPAKGTEGVDHYPVIWLTRKMPKGGIVHEFLCGCRGWWYNEKDECKHVRDLRHQIETNMEKAVSG